MEEIVLYDLEVLQIVRLFALTPVYFGILRTETKSTSTSSPFTPLTLHSRTLNLKVLDYPQLTFDL